MAKSRNCFRALGWNAGWKYEKYFTPGCAVGGTRAARPSASRRATLQRHHNMLGIVGLCGSALVAILSVGLLALRSYATFPSKTPLIDTIRSTETIDQKPPSRTSS